MKYMNRVSLAAAFLILQKIHDRLCGQSIDTALAARPKESHLYTARLIPQCRDNGYGRAPTVNSGPRTPIRGVGY